MALPVAAVLWCVAALLVAGVARGRRRARGPPGARDLRGRAGGVRRRAESPRWRSWSPAAAPPLTLPLGLPWLGAHFRLDALAAFFLGVVNLGGAAASLYGLGYGRHEPAPHRVLPFFPAFLAAMNLVVLADDAFTFLLSWEFMSLDLLGARGRAPPGPGQCPRRLHLPGDGELRHARAAAGLRPARRAGRRLRLRCDPRRGPWPRHRGAGAGAGAARRRLEGGPRAAPRLAAARPSGRAEPRLGADERRDDQGRGLRLRADRLRPAGRAQLVGEHGGPGARRRHRRARRAVRADAARPEAPAGLPHGREHRHHLYRPRPRARLPGQRHEPGRGAGADRGAVPRAQPLAVQEPPVLRRGRGADRDRRARHGAPGRPDPPHARRPASRSWSAASRSPPCRRSTASSPSG